ncbi:unnamed protein product [Cyclocybe aegerita]|uniref:Prokaryotic-type class I peptide chain release factors domain-containing protein n=1 Tax=Cyclocybe aegerita TaxID=1973307 RepID=A0A8S0VQW8_CYCAE|nr:unnamed protein product [Cyclocybe aegerita]
MLLVRTGVHQTLARHAQLPLPRLMQTAPSASSRSLPEPPDFSQLTTEKQHAAASKWVSEFTAPDVQVTKDLVDISFSRSSGPGGQNVNKVDTKATIRCSVNASWIPRWSHPALIQNPHYVASSHSILITSTVHRSQSQNVEDCLDKLHTIVLEAASSLVKNPTSLEQKKKVQDLMKADKVRWKEEKMKRSSIKQARSAKRDFDD